MTTPEEKKLLTEWAVLDQLWRSMNDSDVRTAIAARRDQLRAQISALVDLRRAA
jgi:hypothetical protein